jgi:hypothetical protein
MQHDIETIIYTEDNVRISVSNWDNDGAWLSIQRTGASMYASLTRKEAEELCQALQTVLGEIA